MASRSYDARMESRFVTINGVSINYGASEPSGPPLVFLPGFPSSWQDYEPWLDGLAVDYTVLCPSLRGTGQSGHAAPYRIADWIADVGAFIRAVTDPPVLGAGHSAGSWFGLAAACSDPHLFRAFVSLDQPLNPEVHVEYHRPRVPIYGAYAKAMRAASGREELARLLADVPTTSGQTLGELESEEELLADAEYFLATDPEVFAAWENDTLTQWLLVPELQSWPGDYRGPLLFLDGDPDAGSLVSPEARAYNLERYPWADRVEIAAADHMLHLDDDPGSVVAEIRRYFSYLDADS